MALRKPQFNDEPIDPEILPVVSSHERARQIADFLDDRFEIPGLRVRVGWDGIIGLIPGIGDVVTTVMALAVVYQAMLTGAPSSLLVRMIINIGVDAVIGAVPVVGDIADFGMKASRRNVRLLNSYVENPRHVQVRSRVWIAVLIGVFTCAIIGFLFLAWYTVTWLMSRF